MSKSYVHRPTYSPSRGIDTSVDKLNLPQGHNSQALNVMLPRGTSATASRPGYSRTGGYETVGATRGWGLFPYIDTHPATGTQSERLITFDIETGLPYELVERGLIVIDSAGTHTARLHVMTMSGDGGQRTFQILDADGEEVYISGLDSHTDHIPVRTVQDLVDGINGAAIAGITATIGDCLGTEMVADFLPIMDDVALSPAGTILNGRAWQAIKVADGVATHVLTYRDTLGDPNAEMPTSTNIQNCLYIGFGGDIPVLKFDGHRMYVAGMSPPSGSMGNILVHSTTSGSIKAGTYAYLAAYEQRDAKGNIIEGLAYARSEIVEVDGGFEVRPLQVDTTGTDTSYLVPRISRLATSGYNLNKAQVNGNQTFSATPTPTITVDSGHTMEVGDTACFLARRSLQVGADPYIALILCTAEVTATTSTTIVLDTEWDVTYLSTTLSVLDNETPVQLFEEVTAVPYSTLIDFSTVTSGSLALDDNFAISNNLRVNLYRNKGEGLTELADFSSTYYLAAIMPNPSSTDNDDWTDVLPDELLGPALIQKIDFQGSPWPEEFTYSLPKGRYLTSARDRLYIAGIPNAPDVVDRSDILFGAEWVDPRGLSQLSMDFGQGDRVSGIRAGDDYLLVGKTGSIVLVDGDLSSETNLRVRTLSAEVNCLSHDSMKNLLGGVVFASRLGPMIYRSGSSIDFLGKSDVSGKSKLDGVFADLRDIDSQRIRAEIDAVRGLYLLYVPDAVDGTQDGSSATFEGLQAYTTPTSIAAAGALYAFDVLNGAWFKWTGIDPSGGMAFLDGELYFTRVGYVRASGDYASRTYVVNSSGSIYDHVDWYAPISCAVGTPWDTLGEPFHSKMYQRAAVLCVDSSVPDQALTVTTYVNYDDATVSSSYSATLGSSQRRHVGKLRTVKANSLMAVVSSATRNQRTLFSAVELEASAQFRPKLGVTSNQ